MIEVVSIIASAAVAIAAILGLVYAHYKEMAEVRERLARLETKVEPIWSMIQTSLLDLLRPKGSNPEPLSEREQQKDELLMKLKEGVIAPDEAAQLEGILQEDMERAKRDRNVAIAIAIGLALALLATKKQEGKRR